MKRVLSILLIFALIFSVSACTSKAQTNCYACNESCSEESKFCQNCGANLMESDQGIKIESDPVDYSNFGFENNYGMNEWIEIWSYNFEDKDNPYVLVSQSLNIKVFENNTDGNYCLERYFSTKLFKGDSSIGELQETLKYNIITNNLIEFQTTNYPTWEINVVINSGIPIIYEAKESYYDEPELVPTYFIDWSRELEGVIVNKEDGEQSFYNKYYIKSEYIK